ncbi:MAG: sugar ABC transporter permease, partial [Bacillota bacterium]|nr:sugar ABC transporter permease [Bacillota bacterium]
MKSFFRKRIFWIFLLPSLFGMLLFYIIPYIASYYYATTDATTGAFVGLDHYAAMLSNSSFQLAGRNTLFFMMICVPLNIILPFCLAYLYHTSGRKGIFVLAFMLPLVIPSGATVYFWKMIFGSYGLINKILVINGMQQIPFFQSELALYVVILVFMLKNIGFNMVLFITGLS